MTIIADSATLTPEFYQTLSRVVFGKGFSYLFWLLATGYWLNIA